MAKKTMARIRFGKMLKRVLKAAGISQMEIAEMIGVTPQFISGIVTGNFSTPRSKFDSICAILENRIEDRDFNSFVEAFAEEKINDDEEQKLPVARNPYEEITVNALEMLFLKKFHLLLPEQQIKIMNTLEQYERDNEYRQAAETGPEPSKGK
ncbi:MAG: Helix-turn-helix domain protein [Lentisphaerae bacterium ADurb.Bin242]|nr:MAG: Helix-turn-helix domain protein [Lentisphaerae bacterium ADurb.Bin242]